MKKLIFSFLLCLSALSLFAQEPAPIPATLKQLTTNQFYLQLPDSAIWQYKGVQFGWSRLGRYSEIKNGLATKANVADSIIKWVTASQLQTKLAAKADLDATGKVPMTQISDALVGSVNYQGSYNATTNNPVLGSATGKKGQYYVVSTAGTFNSIDFNVGDWVISNGLSWQKVDNNNSVSRVFGRTGTVMAQSSDYSSFYPLKDGTGANGTWGINISGNAASATYWGGGQADFLTTASQMSGFVGYSTATNKFMSFNGNDAKAFLGLGTAAYLPAPTLQSVTDASNSTTNKMLLLKDADQLRLKSNGVNYSDIASGLTGTIITYGSSGQEAIRILHESGNIGIGTATPDYKLTVSVPDSKTGSPATTTVSGFTSNDPPGQKLGLFTRLHVDPTPSSRWAGITSVDNGQGAAAMVLQDLGGNVGIGTFPTVRLDVAGAIRSNAAISVDPQTDGASSIEIGTAGNNTNGGYTYIQPSYRGITYNAPLVLQNQQSGGNVGIGTITPEFKLDVNGDLKAKTKIHLTGGLSNAVGQGAYFYMANGLVGASERAQLLQLGADGDLMFMSNPGGTWGETVRIKNSNGNIGIGTANESVYSTANRKVVSINGVGGGALIDLKDNDTSTGYIFSNGVATELSGSTRINFITNNGLRSTILSNGNFGIGTDNPIEKLTVAGNGSFTGTVKVATPTAPGDAANKAYVDAVIGSGGGVPTASLGVSAGAGATVSLSNANDNAGYISVTTGSDANSHPGGLVLTVNFSTPYSGLPKIILTPANFQAATLGTGQAGTLYFVYIPKSGITGSKFEIWVGSGALGNSNTYEFAYHVIK